MKYLKTFFAFMLMAVLSIGQVWADDEVVYTLTPATGSDNGYASAEDIDITDGETTIKWNVTGNSTLTPWRLGGKSLSGVNRVVYSKTAMSDAITKVELEVGTASSITVNSLTLIVASDAAFNTVIDEVSETFAASSTITFSPTSPKTEWDADAYYKFVFNVTVSGKNNKYVEFTKADFYAEAAAPAYTITAQSNDESKGTVSLTGSVITGSPKSGCRYASPAYTVTSGTATVAQSGDAFTVTPSSDCTVRINFEAIPQYTVTWDNNGSTSTSQVLEGNKPVFPATPTSCDATSKTFIGWATEAWTGKLANLTGKTVYTSASAMPDVDAAVTYYAVFAKSSGSAGNLFEWEGGTSSALTALENVTASGLGSDYAEGNAPYRVKFDTEGDYIVITTSGAIESVAVGAKMLGGGNTSHIYVQEAEDAESDFSAVETLTISGAQNDVLDLETENAFKADSRAVKLLFNKGSNVGVGPITIAGAASASDYMTTCTAAGTVATPTFSVIAGTYNVAKSVELNCETDGATIYYTTDGNDPDNTSTEYTGTAIPVTQTTTIKAIAIKDGLTDSEIATATYTLQCATPTISKTPKHFLETANVTITCADGETIHYTTNGSDPTTSSATYTAPFSINATTTVKAIAVKTNWSNSAVASETFTKAETPLTVAQARDVIDGGTGLTGRYVVGTIYQIDNYNSTYNSITYWISDDGTSTTPLQVYSGKGLDGANFSAITDLSVGDVVTVYGTLKLHNSTVYEFDKNNEIAKIVKNVATPAFAPLGSGFLSNTLEVSLATTETGDGVEIRYTTDGSDPTSTSTLYSEPIEITASTTFKAATFKGGNASAVVEKKYVKGTKINVAAALEALGSNDPIADQFVYGIVSTAPTYLNNGKLTYSISDDGTTTDELKVFNGYNLSGANFTDKTDIQVGDLVTVFGELTEYNSEKEFSQGNHLVEFARLADPELSWSAASAVVGITGDKNYPNLTNDYHVDVTYQSTDESIATIDADGNVTLVAAGETTIKAIFAGDETYKAATVSYTLEVREILVYATITYNCDGATTGCPDPAVVENQTNLPSPLPTVTKTGFNFGGWFTNSAKTEAAVAGAALTGDVTLYADWIEIPTFNNSAYEWQLVTSNAQLVAGKYYVLVHTTSGNTMTKSIDNYATVVASTIEDGVIAYNALGANAAVFQLGGTSAAWTLTEATTGDLLGATTGKNFSLESNQAWTIEIEDNDASITNTTDGCGVICYNTSANPKRFKPYASSNNGTPLPQLYVWALKTYKLRYDANGGTNAPSATSAANGKAIVTDAQPTKEDKIFNGWNANQAGTGESYAAGDEVSVTDADVTIYAQWRDPEQYTVSYNANGGILIEGETAIENETVTEGESYTIKANVYEKEGFVFGGWEYNGEVYAKDAELTIPAGDVEFVAKWNGLNVTEFVLVTNIDQLLDGDKVYIVAAGYDVAMSTQSGNIRTYVEISKSNGHVVVANDDPVEFTLGKVGNYYTFHDGTGYLCATSSGSNYIGTQEELDDYDNGKWAVTISTNEGVTSASITAQGTNSKNQLKWNNSQPRFSCYGSGQSDVAIYKKVNPLREVAAGTWGTFCPEKEVKYPTGASFFTLTYKEVQAGVPYKIFFDEIGEGESLEAGKPYLFISDGDIKGVETGSAAASSHDYNGFHGIVSSNENVENGKYSFTVTAEEEAAYKYYILYQGQIRLCGAGTYNIAVGRAYINMSELTGNYVAPAPGRRRVGMANPQAPQTPTDIDATAATGKAMKIIFNDQLLILRDGKLYDTTGRLVGNFE